MSEAAAPATAEAGEKKASKLSLDLIVVLLNTLALAGAGGMLVYTKLVFKRPPITEESERERLAKMHEKAQAPLVPGSVTFEQFTANIEPSPARPGGVDAAGLQIRGHLHYATMAFALELRDTERADDIEELRPRIMDALLGIMGHKNFNELSSAQGRYLLRTQFVETINRLVARYESPGPAPAEAKLAATSPGDDEEYAPAHEGLVTNVYFTQFIVQ